MLVSVKNLFSKGRKVFYLDYCAVIKHGFSCKIAKYLVLVCLNYAKIHLRAAVNRWLEIHLKAPI